VWFILVGAAAWGAYVVLVRPGMIEISVAERDWDVRRSMTLYVPAAFANGAIRLTGLLDDAARVHVLLDGEPLEIEWRGDRELAELVEILEEELEKEGDLRILSVRDGDEFVTIDFHDGSLEIEAESWHESVSITFPPSTLRAAFDVAEDLSY
ncbi:MAG: hypothetical protein R3338_05460, partial [Thermoanaerobaculia bacterium]|nr:hypothetical protein [Thermoanaerobaculia bacterium]